MTTFLAGAESAERMQAAPPSTPRTDATFRALIERSPELVIVHRDDRIVYANPAAVTALGYGSRDELYQHGFLSDVVAPDDRELAMERTVESDARTSIPPVLVRWRCRDGAVRATETLAMPFDFEGEAATVVVARDVTEQNELQATRLRADRMTALGTLAAGVAHEINNPLTYLLLDLERVLRRFRTLAASQDPGGELTREDLDACLRSLTRAVEGADRVRQIVRSLVIFSQGNVEHRGLVDVRGIVESAVQMAWHEIRHRARLDKNLREVPPVEANEAQLGGVFLALMVNAAQAIPEGHADENSVSVATRADDLGNVVVEIADTGTGIAPEALPRIFDPFFTTKGELAGVGLGLSIAHGIVRELGGTLRARSEKGKGSTFTLSLPAARPYRRVPSGAWRALIAERKRVLVIDDEPLVREAIAEALSGEIEVTHVGDAKEGLELLLGATAPFDLVLCDLMMPVMTGMDLYVEVVRTAPNLAGRIVFMTGGVFTGRAKSFLESVGNSCLEKPLQIGKLRSLLARS